MNISVYLFGEFPNGYSQYPNDHTATIFRQFHSHARSTTQIAIHRDGNLMYYGYIRKLQATQYIGICAILNGTMLSQFDPLFSIYENAISQLVYREILLRFNKDGMIESSIESLNTVQNEIEFLTELLNSKFKQLNNITLPLPPVNYGISKDSVKAFTIQDSPNQILQSSYTEGYTYIHKSKGYNTTQLNRYQKILHQRNRELQELNKKYNTLIKEHAKTLKQKKQFKTVCLLSVIVAGTGIFTLMLNTNLTKTHQELSLAQDSIMQKDTAISLLNAEISNLTIKTKNLNNTIRKEKSQRQILEKKLSTAQDSILLYHEKINSLQTQTEEWKAKIFDEIPLIISKVEMGNTYEGGNIETAHGNTLYSSQTMYLQPKVHYFGIKQQQVTLYIKFFTPSGNLSNNEKSPAGYSYSNSINIKKGENTFTITSWGSKNKGFWKSGSYRIEIWHDNTCLKTHTFTIH